MRDRAAVVVATLLLTCACTVRAQTPLAGVAGTDANILDAALDGQKLAIAGGFMHVGRPCGSWVSFDLATGAPDEAGPVVSGRVAVAIPDGSGGFFLGGFIRGVNGIPRQGLVHLLADGSLAPWAPAVTGLVESLALRGDTLFVGGGFTAINGTPRWNLAAVDANTGDVLPWYVPADAYVTTLELADDTLYVGGYFRNLGSFSRVAIGAIDARTATVTPWTLQLGAYDLAYGTPIVNKLVHEGNRLYVGGDFKSVGTTDIAGFAAVDRASGQLLHGALMCCGGTVFQILLHGGRIYLSGQFNLSPAPGLSANGLLAISRVTLDMQPWAPVLPRYRRDGAAIAASGDRLFVSEGQLDYNYPAEPLNVVDTLSGAQLPFAGSVRSVGGSEVFAISGGRLFAGGPFQMLSSVPRSTLAEIDLASGHCTDRTFTLIAGEAATKVAAEAGRVFAWTIRNDLVAFDSGSSPIWRRHFQGVEALLASHGHLIVAGRESTSTAFSRAYDIDPATGETRSWAPSFTDPTGSPSVEALATDDDHLYLGGIFQSVDGQPSGGIVAYRWSDLGLEPTSYAGVQRVHGLTAAGGMLIAMGDVVGRADPTLATLDATTGALLPWDPLHGFGALTYSFSGPAVLDGDVFAGNGDTYSRPGRELFYHAPLSGPGWTPYPISGDGYPSRILSGNGRLVVAGGFVGFGPVAASNVGVIVSPSVDVPRSLVPRPRVLAVSPDPARDRVAIRWGELKVAPVRLEIFDVAGRRVRTLAAAAASGSLDWDLRGADGARVAPGVHFAVMTAADGTRSTARFVVLR